MVKPKRPKACQDVEGELSTFVTKNTITVKPDGEVILKMHKKQTKKL